MVVYVVPVLIFRQNHFFLKHTLANIANKKKAISRELHNNRKISREYKKEERTGNEKYSHGETHVLFDGK